jgi:hypothetical protein
VVASYVGRAAKAEGAVVVDAGDCADAARKPDDAACGIIGG